RSGMRARHDPYDAVIDLQRNKWSRLVRRLAVPRAFGEFDRFSPKSARERVAEAFASSGLAVPSPPHDLPLKPRVRERARELLGEAGWDGAAPLVVLNPAGIWPSRHWPVEHYAALAEMLAEESDARVLLLGTGRMKPRSDALVRLLGRPPVDLIGRTTPGEALGVLVHATLAVSEDSGLMHMAWVSGVPTVALFGSSPHIWSAPSGEHTVCLHSGDLPCGSCMEPVCRYGDVHCLTRRTPGEVFSVCRRLTVCLPRGGAAP
ncbi:MAG: glycosyltransferase family 9 protein, partial [Bacteroidota bacterium]